MNELERYKNMHRRDVEEKERTQILITTLKNEGIQKETQLHTLSLENVTINAKMNEFERNTIILTNVKLQTLTNNETLKTELTKMTTKIFKLKEKIATLTMQMTVVETENKNKTEQQQQEIQKEQKEINVLKSKILILQKNTSTALQTNKNETEDITTALNSLQKEYNQLEFQFITCQQKIKENNNVINIQNKDLQTVTLQNEENSQKFQHL